MTSQVRLESQINNQQNQQFNTNPEFYNDDLNQSKVHSVVSQNPNPQNLLKFFKEYEPKNPNFSLAKLHTSPHLKLKKYKESIYYGDFVNEKRQGQGIMMYNTGRIYEGDWQCDYKHGQGYQKFPNQCVYQGEYINGKPEGVGRYSWPNGQFYEGEWANGLKQGSGMWRGAKGDSYIGEWKFGKADGYGVHTWVNGDRYEGEFKDCLKHGEGIQKFANGDIYKGLYANGKPWGFGEYYWLNGSYFKGTFKNGLRDGQGIWKKSPGNSDKYEGEYVNDKKSGFGIFSWATGNVYKGNYQSDVRNGYGEMYWNDGSFYKGEWKNGIQHGEGQIYVPGEGYKKGMFEDNILVVVEQSSATVVDNKNNYFLASQNNIQDPQKVLYKSKSKRSNELNGYVKARPSFRNRGFSSKGRPSEAVQIDQNNVIRYGVPIGKNYPKDSISTNLTSIPQKFMQRQQKYVTLDRKKQKPKIQTKQRILHSSFYMHKLHNRTVTSGQSKRTDTRSGGSHQQKSFHQDAIQQMRYFNKSRVSSNVPRTPHC